MFSHKKRMELLRKEELIKLPDSTITPFDSIFKVYNDGGHHVATRVVTGNMKGNSYSKFDNDFDRLYSFCINNNVPQSKYFEYIKNGFVNDYNYTNSENLDKMIDNRLKITFTKSLSHLNYAFDELYFLCMKSDIPSKNYFNTIKNGLIETYNVQDNFALNEYVKSKIKDKLNNLHKRKKLFKRKANLNKWNYFCSFTYDDKKHDAESFRKKLRKCLSNFHTRRNWRYMGVFEYGEENERLHFHCLMYIPNGEMVGEITKLDEFSIRLGKMKTRHANSFFDERFGRSDFAPINATEMTINYILKYIAKTGERIVYSRGIASYILTEIQDKDIACAFFDFCYKYVLFDDVIDWETDVMNFKPYQTSMLC